MRGVDLDGMTPDYRFTLADERTFLVWIRTALALAAFSALLVHLAERDRLAAVPGLVGLVLALALLVLGERRYAWTVRRVEAAEACVAPGLVRLLAVGIVGLSATSLVPMVVTET